MPGRDSQEPRFRDDDGRAVVARELRKTFGGRAVVDGIDFSVRSGECLGFLGPNGAGKSTTMKMIYGLAGVTSGRLSVLGHDAARGARAIKARLGVVPQNDNLDTDLTVAENLLVQAGYHGLDRRAAASRTRELLALALLDRRGDASPTELSGGMRRQLLIARALVGDPQLVILDEPTTGLDPRARRTVWEMLGDLRRAGTTLLLTTHYMEEATHLCDRLVIMSRGRIVDEGPPGTLLSRHRQPDLEALFLHLTGEELQP